MTEYDPAGQVLTGQEAARLAISPAILAQTPRVPAIVKQGRQMCCNRCELRLRARDARLPNGRWYCHNCLMLGRLTSEDDLYVFPSHGYPTGQVTCTWTGHLTSAQQQAAATLVASYQAGRRHLLWAVTGAGKTEMLFPVLHTALNAGARVAVVSPRIDVILELAPRLQAAFATVPIAVRYGESGPVPVEQFLLATVHQLLRFKAAFDLIVVDEVDAFPYAGDPMLERAVAKAARGAQVFLTATPGPHLLRGVRRNRLQMSYLPRRFHGHPLPVPRLVFTRGLGLSDRRVQRVLNAAVRWGARCLVFVPGVAQLAPVQQFLTRLGYRCATVHAAEPERQQRVQALRRGDLDVLVTTTILERGVTFANCAVVVLQADAPLFSLSALVQMAGRAGRAADFADDPVWFCAQRYTRAMAGAIAQIKQLNRRHQ